MNPVNLNALMGLRRGWYVFEILRQVQVYPFVTEAGGRQDCSQVPPLAGQDTCFFGKFTPRGLRGVFCRRIQLSRGDFPYPAARGVPVLPDQAYLLRRIQRDHGGATDVPDDFQFGLGARGQPYTLPVEPDYLAGVEGFDVAHGIRRRRFA